MLVKKAGRVLFFSLDQLYIGHSASRVECRAYFFFNCALLAGSDSDVRYGIRSQQTHAYTI